MKKVPVQVRRSRWRWLWRVGAVGVLLAILVYYFRPGEETEVRGTTFVARRGPLRITILEGGTVEALESQQIKSEVKGQTKILAIVEEGYMVTEQDVADGKILVELDSTDLLERQIAQELDYQNALAAFTEATEAFDIQLNQNRSDITSAELAVKFAGMDFAKYLGAKGAAEILALLPKPVEEKRPLETPEEAAEAPGDDGGAENGDAIVVGNENAAPAAESVSDTEAVLLAEIIVDGSSEARPEIDFQTYADAALLGDGEAGQRLRKLDDDLVLSEQELKLAKTTLEGTERLAAREFVTKNDLETEQLKVRRNEISFQSAETSRVLFIRYEFPKQAEKLLSDCEEAVRKLQRAKKLAVSKLAQARAKLKSSEARYVLQAKKRKELVEQIEKCKIPAERPGLVVYGSGDNRYYRSQEQIEEGATVRERQGIITIPDMTQMAVKVKIHESAIKRIEKGQRATVTIDAYAEQRLEGEVIKVGVLPDSSNRWMNPDVKVYETVVTIDGVHDWLKPGMSAEVEILVEELPDVLYVPIQAVAPRNGDRVVYLAGLVKPDARVVETGEYNDEFIEVKNGLSEGDEVLLRAPISTEEAEGQSNDKGGNGASAQSDGKDKDAGGGRSRRPAAGGRGA
ncbi:MAG: HlyD family efflux transporter periplasmic adaptor subunit [Nitrospiraceae bacterium]|nr:HlyD family efflux transporter periplasmic adaptor subunit [Nitrospiraceae bacterium]